MTSNILDLVEHNEDFKKSVTHKLMKFNAKDVIIKEDSQPKLYLILKGSVRVRTSHKEEEGITSGLASLGAGDTIGEMSLFDDHPASADVIAVLDTELIEFDNASLLQFFSKHPDVGYKVLLEMLQTVGLRLREANKAVLRMVSWGLKTKGG